VFRRIFLGIGCTNYLLFISSTHDSIDPKSSFYLDQVPDKYHEEIVENDGFSSVSHVRINFFLISSIHDSINPKSNFYPD